MCETQCVPSLPPECPLKGAKCETLGRSVAHSGMMRRRGRNRRGGLENWRNSRVLRRLPDRAGQFRPRFVEGFEVGNAETIRHSLWNDPSEGERCETLGRSFARSGMIRRKGRKRRGGLEGWRNLQVLQRLTRSLWAVRAAFSWRMRGVKR